MSNREQGHKSESEGPADFEMPSAREIELELALGSDCWQSLLDPDRPWHRSGGADGFHKPCPKAL